jgi:hypothetical protein
MLNSSCAGGWNSPINPSDQKPQLLMLCSVQPTAAQIEHGSVGVIYYTPEKIVMAADSRVSPGSGAPIPPANDGCKLAAIDGKIVFVSTGLVRTASWDNNDIIRSAYSKVKSAHPKVSEYLLEIAKEWAVMVRDRFNSVALLQSQLFRRMISDNGPGALTIAHMGGLSGTGELVLFQMSVTPNVSSTGAVGSAGPIPACSNHNFCASGVINVVLEFVNSLSERAKREALEWRPPKGTLSRDYDIFKAKRLVELTILHQDGKDVGGPIDAVQLSRDGSIHWQALKSICPGN